MPTEARIRNSLRPNGFTLVELSIVVSIAGLLVLLVMVAWNPVGKQIRFQQLVSEVAAIASAMRWFAGPEGVVSKEYLQVQKSDQCPPASGLCPCTAGTPAKQQFKIQGLQLRKPKRTLYSITNKDILDSYPEFMDEFPMETADDPSDPKLEIFRNPYSGLGKGYEIETDTTCPTPTCATSTNSDCVSTHPYTDPGVTKWRLLIYDVPNDLHQPLEKKLRGYLAVETFQSSSTAITVTFDEKRHR